jgi:hypothetical protein
MPESIGSVYPTQIPSLSDDANIQEALRLYHYGQFSQPGSTIQQSISGYLESLQDQISSNQADLEIIKIMGAF